MSSDEQKHSPEKLARALIRKRDFPRAIEVLQKMLEESPTDPDIMEMLGTALFFNKQAEEAREMFEQMTVTDPYRANGWINLGAVLNQLGDHKKAVEALRRGLQRDRQNAEAYYNMGMAQKALKLNTMALSAYKEAIRIRPEFVDAHLNLGTLYAEMKNLGLAQQCYQAALRIDPQSKKAKTLLEQTQGTQKQVRKSASPFGRLVDEAGLAANLKSTARRVLDNVQRTEEREMVQAMTKRVRSRARELVPLLDEDVHHLLHQLQIVSVQGDNRFANPDTHEKFVTVIRTLKELHGVVAEGFDEIRTHLEQ